MKIYKCLSLVFLFCNIAAADNRQCDLSVSSVTLLDPDSTKSILGDDIKVLRSPDALYTQFYNKTGKEMLTAMFVSENNPTSFREMRVAKLDKKFLLNRKVLKNISKFTTGNGIYLGITEEQLVSQIGGPSEKIPDGEILRLKYQSHKQACILPSYVHGKYSYTAIYSFEYGKLSEMRLSLKHPAIDPD